MQVRLALEAQDTKKLLAIGGISLALTVGTSTTVFATPFAPVSDIDQDGFSSKIETKTTQTDPPDPDNDGIKDGEDDGCNGEDAA